VTGPDEPAAPAPTVGGARSALLLLADGRLPTGGHAHSGGLEQAVRRGAVRTAADLADWLEGRLAVSGTLDAAVATLAWREAHRSEPRWAELAAEVWARTPSPAQRDASRAQGRGMLRAARRCWPASALEVLAADLTDGAPAAVALGVAGVAAGATAVDTATAAAWSALSGPGWAATRLLGLDPFAVAACLAGLGAALDATAVAAARRWAEPGAAAADLPRPSAPLLELGAEDHATWEVRLFAS